MWNGKSTNVKNSFLQHNPDNIFVIKAELVYGAMKSPKLKTCGLEIKFLLIRYPRPKL